ncbi:MAG: flagellar biosynthetic protein FliO [Terracidiphilus sp.]
MRRDGKAMTMAVGGVAGWILSRFGAHGRRQPRLELVERIALAPRQSLALVEAEGRRILVATSPEGAPAFFALDERARPNGVRQAASRQRGAALMAARVSW